MNTAFYRVCCSVLAVLPLAACKSVPIPSVPGVTPYRMVIQQGNFISQEMVAQLKPGMTREQVRFVLGTPLVSDIFHADRWDYVYFREADGKKEQRNLSVIFEKDRLARVIGDLMPADAAAPQATGFNPLLKPEPPKPAATVKPAATPAAPPPATAAAPLKPDAVPPPPTGDAPKAAAEPAPEAKSAEAKAPEETKPEEKGFFGRMMEKIGL